MTRRMVLMVAACAGLVHAEDDNPVQRSWTMLKDAAADKSYETRVRAFSALQLIGNEPQARELAEKAMAEDQRSEVRAAAAAALGEMRASESVGKLKDIAFSDKSGEVVLAAANALYQLGDPAAYQIYYGVLTGEKKSGEGLIESQLKMLKDPKALAKMGLQEGVAFIPFGGISYQVFKMLREDSASPVRAVSATRLAEDPDPKTTRALAEATRDPKWLVRAAVLGAIAQRGDPSLLPSVLLLLDDEHSAVRFHAAAATIRLSGTKSDPQ